MPAKWISMSEAIGLLVQAGLGTHPGGARPPSWARSQVEALESRVLPRKGPARQKHVRERDVHRVIMEAQARAVEKRLK